MPFCAVAPAPSVTLLIRREIADDQLVDLLRLPSRRSGDRPGRFDVPHLECREDLTHLWRIVDREKELAARAGQDRRQAFEVAATERAGAEWQDALLRHYDAPGNILYSSEACSFNRKWLFARKPNFSR